jgi:hypothetical protein
MALAPQVSPAGSVGGEEPEPGGGVNSLWIGCGKGLGVAGGVAATEP